MRGVRNVLYVVHLKNHGLAVPSLTGCRAQRQSNLKSQIEFQIEIQCSKSMLSLISLTKSIFSVMSFTNTLHLIQRPAPWHDWCIYCRTDEEMYRKCFFVVLLCSIYNIREDNTSVLLYITKKQETFSHLPLVVFSYAGDLLWFWDKKKTTKKLEYHKILYINYM